MKAPIEPSEPKVSQTEYTTKTKAKVRKIPFSNFLTLFKTVVQNIAAAPPVIQATINVYIILATIRLTSKDCILAILSKVIVTTMDITPPMVDSVKSTVFVVLVMFSLDIKGIIIAKELSAKMEPKITA